MKPSFHGQSTIYLESNGGKVVADPFIPGNDKSDLDEQTLDVDYIILMHGYGDHSGNIVELANRSYATVIGSTEVQSCLTTYHGIEHAHGMNIGGKYKFDLGTVKFIQAFHSSSYTNEDGIPIYLGMPVGAIIEAEGKTIYHAGDTGLFSDMKLIAERHPVDVCFIPIGGNFTMGIEDASYAISEFIRPKISVPIHYNTFPLTEQDPEKLKEAVSQGEVQISQSGDEATF